MTIVEENPTTTTLTPIEVLEKALGLIRAGWCRGAQVRVGSDGDKYCTFGALVAAAGGLDSPDYFPARQILSDTLLEWGTSHSLIRWNDDPGRTQAEVVKLFEAALGRARDLS